MDMKELVFNVCYKKRSLTLIQSDISRQKNYFFYLRILILGSPYERCGGPYLGSKGP